MLPTACILSSICRHLNHWYMKWLGLFNQTATSVAPQTDAFTQEGLKCNVVLQILMDFVYDVSINDSPFSACIATPMTAESSPVYLYALTYQNSQNHRIIRVGRHLQRSSSPDPLLASSASTSFMLVNTQLQATNNTTLSYKPDWC